MHLLICHLLKKLYYDVFTGIDPFLIACHHTQELEELLTVSRNEMKKSIISRKEIECVHNVICYNCSKSNFCGPLWSCR